MNPLHHNPYVQDILSQADSVKAALARFDSTNPNSKPQSIQQEYLAPKTQCHSQRPKGVKNPRELEPKQAPVHGRPFAMLSVTLLVCHLV